MKFFSSPGSYIDALPPKPHHASALARMFEVNPDPVWFADTNATQELRNRVRLAMVEGARTLIGGRYIGHRVETALLYRVKREILHLFGAAFLERIQIPLRHGADYECYVTLGENPNSLSIDLHLREHAHDCSHCIYLGTPISNRGGEHCVDLYWCPQQGLPALVARHSSKGSSYESRPLMLCRQQGFGLRGEDPDGLFRLALKLYREKRPDVHMDRQVAVHDWHDGGYSYSIQAVRPGRQR